MRADLGGPRQFGWRSGSGRRRDPRRRRHARLRRAASGQIRPFRSLDENVGGDHNRPASDSAGETQRVVKGAFAVVSGLARPQPARCRRPAGWRGRDSACWPWRWDRPQRWSSAGLIALSDPPAAIRPRCERIAGARRAHRNGDRGRAANGGDVAQAVGWRVPCVRPGRSQTRCVRNPSPCSPACFRKKSITLSKRFRPMGSLWACAATASTMPRHCVRPRSASRFQPPLTSPNRQPAWC